MNAKFNTQASEGIAFPQTPNFLLNNNDDELDGFIYILFELIQKKQSLDRNYTDEEIKEIEEKYNLKELFFKYSENLIKFIENNSTFEHRKNLINGLNKYAQIFFGISEIFAI